MTPSDRQSLRDAGQPVCLVCGSESKYDACRKCVTPKMIKAGLEKLYESGICYSEYPSSADELVMVDILAAALIRSRKDTP